ncbi:MAG: hypothetical protein VYC80_11985, partial [Planctomycetota bacterium]|nr:hypothetical protein [Planctomycetota bacterium]
AQGNCSRTSTITSTASLLDLAFTLYFRLDLWIMTDSDSDFHCDGVASWRERSRWLVLPPHTIDLQPP